MTKFSIGSLLLFVLFIAHALVGAVELGTDGWITLLEVPPRPVPQEITFTDAAVSTASRYYRVLVAPAMP